MDSCAPGVRLQTPLQTCIHPSIHTTHRTLAATEEIASLLRFFLLDTAVPMLMWTRATSEHHATAVLRRKTPGRKKKKKSATKWSRSSISTRPVWKNYMVEGCSFADAELRRGSSAGVCRCVLLHIHLTSSGRNPWPNKEKGAVLRRSVDMKVCVVSLESYMLDEVWMHECTGHHDAHYRSGKKG